MAATSRWFKHGIAKQGTIKTLAQTINKNVLIKIVSGADAGGVRSAELGFISELKTRGVAVLVVVFGSGKTAQAYADAADYSVFHEMELPGFSGSIQARAVGVVRNTFLSISQSANLLKTIQGAVGSGSILGVAFRRPNLCFISGRLGRSLQVPTLWHLPNTVSGRLARVYYRSAMALWRVDAIGNSRHSISSLGFADGDVVYPGFRPSRIGKLSSKEEARGRFGVPVDAALFSVAARLVWDKAPDLVLRAFLGSEAFRGGAHLVIAGGPLDTDFGRSLLGLADSEGEGRVQITGEIDDVGTLYGASDVFVNGRRNAEPFGISIAEAMASGLPVIAYKVGGPSEMIRDGSTGWLLDHPTVEAYLDGFERAWSERTQWQEMGRAARESAMAFSVEKQVDIYLAILDRVRRSRGLSRSGRSGE